MVKDENELSIELFKRIAKAGFDCYSLFFIQDDQESTLDLVITLTDGSILLIDTEAFYDSDKEVKKDNALFIKALTKKEFKLNFKNYKFEKLVFIGSDSNIYIFSVLNNGGTFYEIPGNFDDASFVDNKTLITFENGLINSFVLEMKPKEKFFKVAQWAAVNGHTDKVIFHYNKDMMTLTISLDSTLKCFIVKNFHNLILYLALNFK